MLHCKHLPNWIVISMKVYSGGFPFPETKDVTAILLIIDGERPSRPTCSTLTDDVWALIERCWSQDPQTRPGIREVLQDLASNLLRSLRQYTEFLPELEVALCQFYDNTERKHCINRLSSAELKEFINLLDDVRLSLSCLHLNLVVTFRIGATHQGVR